MGCPEPITLSRHADGDLEGAEARQVARHVGGCAACQAAVEAEAALAAGLSRAVCPEPELLALFIDEALPSDRLDLVAGHVLACAPCRDVVTWTREAASASADKRTSGRRKAVRPAGKVLQPSWLPTLIGAAAAASILFMVAVSFQRTPTGTDQASAPRPRTERATPPRTTTAGPRRATEAATEARRPATEPAVTGSPVTEAVTEPPATEPHATEPPTTEPPTTELATERPATEVRPGTERTGTQTPTVREPAPIEVAAVPGARSVRWRDAQGEGELSGVRALRPGTRLLGGRTGGALRIGSAELRLEPQAATRLTFSDDQDAGGGRPRLALDEGELTLEAARADVEVACGPVVIRPAPEGVFLSLASDGADHVVVCCLSGQASLGGAGVPAGVVRPGDAVRVGREGARPARRDPRLAKAEESAIAAALATGLDAPRGVRLAKLIEEAAADLASADPVRQAWAAYALLTARTDRDPKPTQAQLASAAAAVAALAARADLSPAAAAPALLGLATSVDGKQVEEGLARLAGVIAGRPPAELLADTEALLALRVAERRTGWRAPRALWTAVAGAQVPTGPEAWPVAARVALVRPLELAERRNALAALDARLVPGPAVEAAVLLEAARALSLLDPSSGSSTASSEPRRTALLARAAETPRDPRLAVALSLDAGALLGERTPQTASSPASVVGRRLEDGSWRVTFVFRTGRRPKAPTLHGSWDQWAAPGVALRERPDGSFTATLVLPAGRYEYKVRLAEGARWEHDPENPLTAQDGQGGLNSVLILE